MAAMAKAASADLVTTDVPMRMIPPAVEWSAVCLSHAGLFAVGMRW
jgi:hypothetical protein